MTISRRTFLARGIGASSLMLFSPFQMTAIAGPQEDKAPLDRMIVEEFVRVAHSDLDKVKAMLEETPHLLNAAWDWKKGDFETAIGAAGHMGLKDTANYLIEKGSRFDIFVLTMLGKTEIVKPLLELYPHLLHAIGPHGFTLLHHAKQGGDDAGELQEYLLSKGLTETFIKTF